MKVEKIAANKVRIFISYEDLEARGIQRDEMWQNGKKIQELLWDLMEVAYTEVGFEVAGPIAVETFTMPSEGVVVIVTQVPSLPTHGSLQDLAEGRDASHDLFGAFVFSFRDFEDVILAAKTLAPYDGLLGSLYKYRGEYILLFEEDSIEEGDYDAVWSILHEYGELSTVTRAVLDEYAVLISDRYALQTVRRHFSD